MSMIGSFGFAGMMGFGGMGGMMGYPGYGMMGGLRLVRCLGLGLRSDSHHQRSDVEQQTSGAQHMGHADRAILSTEHIRGGNGRIRHRPNPRPHRWSTGVNLETN